MNISKSFLGRGIKFPVEIDKATGKFKMSEFEDDISESIKIILLTRKGERIMRPEFGSRLHDYIFETLDYTIVNSIKNEITETLTLFEPRITNLLIEITSPPSGGGFYIGLSYTVRNTNNPYNLVFPFFVEEGHGLE